MSTKPIDMFKIRPLSGLYASGNVQVNCQCYPAFHFFKKRKGFPSPFNLRSIALVPFISV
jgi:hypothetical protein